MKNIFSFGIIVSTGLFTGLYSKSAYSIVDIAQAHHEVNTMSSSEFLVIWLVAVIAIVSFFIKDIIHFWKNKFPKADFDYNSNYRMYQPNDQVRITYLDGENIRKRKVWLISIDANNLFFEDKNGVYECLASKVINIQKTHRCMAVLVVVAVFFALLAFFTYFGKSKADKENEEDTLYGVITDMY